MRAVYERNSGYLRVEACVKAHAAQATDLGAELRCGESVLGWKAGNDSVTVRTDVGTYSAARLIVSAGAWAGALLESLGLRFEVRRKSLFWFRCDDPAYGAGADGSGFPGFLFETPDGTFYGFPRIDGRTLKTAEHSGGLVVDDPLNVDRDVDPDEQRRLEHFLTAHLPGVSHERKRHAVCLYTVTPDEHFVVDRHPEHPEVAFAAGLSGHGFKFTTVLGEVLAELVLDGQSTRPIEFLGAGRDGLRRES